MKMAKKIYDLRMQYKLTQEELARIAGVSSKSVSAWEIGTRDPKIKPLQNICEHFGIDLNSFIDDASDIYIPLKNSVSNDAKKEIAEMLKKIGENPSKKALIEQITDMDEETVEVLLRLSKKISHAGE